MTETEPTVSWSMVVPREAVVENVGAGYWSVDEAGWASVQPALPAELVDLLAPPVVVACAAQS